MWYQIVLFMTVLNAEGVMSDSRPFYAKEQCQQELILRTIPRIEQHPELKNVRGICIFIEDSDGM